MMRVWKDAKTMQEGTDWKEVMQRNGRMWKKSNAKNSGEVQSQRKQCKNGKQKKTQTKNKNTKNNPRMRTQWQKVKMLRCKIQK